MNAESKIRLVEAALEDLSPQESGCRLCPHECGADRKAGEKGVCQSGPQSAVSTALLHFGEEPVLSGTDDFRSQDRRQPRSRAGSGTIFFTGCNLKCLFCQNYQISWLGEGRIASDEDLAAIVAGLQQKGALNINLVSPTHLILPILRSLRIAYRGGLNLPLVWNSNGYEKADVIRRLDGIVDVFLPDLKYFSPRVAGKFSGARDYFKHAAPAVQEMFRQKPGLILDKNEIAVSGTLIRHLILPGQVDDSLSLLEWVRSRLSPDVSLSLMSQYHPRFRAPEEIQRPLSGPEYRAVLARAEELGFENLFIQPEAFGPEDHLLPDFNEDDPFGFGRGG